MNKSIKIIKQSRRTLPGETQQVPANTSKTENQVQREILKIIREKKILSEVQIKELLDPVKLTGIDKNKYKNSTGCSYTSGF